VCAQITQSSVPVDVWPAIAATSVRISLADAYVDTSNSALRLQIASAYFEVAQSSVFDAAFQRPVSLFPSDSFYGSPSDVVDGRRDPYSDYGGYVTVCILSSTAADGGGDSTIAVEIDLGETRAVQRVSVLAFYAYAQATMYGMSIVISNSSMGAGVTCGPFFVQDVSQFARRSTGSISH
jgi:hypothetical protein